MGERAPLPEGTKVQGYVVGHELGRGAFGITYSGTHLFRDGQVAIKEFFPSDGARRRSGALDVAADNPTDFEAAVTSLEKEAFALKELRHRNVAEVQDFLKQNGTAYLVMKYEEGTSLLDLLRRKITLSEREILDILPPLLDGLEAVHAKGYVHRDLKPSNIYLREADGAPVLLDFGAARRLMGIDAIARVTHIGTPGFQPPEQRLDAQYQGAFTDLYALGATLYCCMTGEAPHDWELRELTIKHQGHDALKPTRKIARRSYLDALHEAVGSCLELDPRRRPQTVADLRALLSLSPRTTDETGGETIAVPATLPLPTAGDRDETRLKDWEVKPPPPAQNNKTSVTGPSRERGLRLLRWALLLALAGATLAFGVLVGAVIQDFPTDNMRSLILSGIFAAIFILVALPGGLILFGRRRAILWLAIGATVAAIYPLFIVGSIVYEGTGLANMEASAFVFHLGVALSAASSLPMWSRSVRALRRRPAAPERPFGRIDVKAGRLGGWRLAAAAILALGAGILIVAQPWKSLGQAAPTLPAAPTVQASLAAHVCREGAGWRADCIFRDCADCPEMVVIPEGHFTMGSPASEAGRANNEGPQHRVTIAKPFALGKYEMTFAEWDACVAAGGCTHRPDDRGWGRGRQPLINVSWEDAKQYVAWLSRKTGRTYRLPSEAEWEYAARAETTTPFSWGDEIGQGRANCSGCGSQWDDKQTAPVGSFAPNPFGLHDMHGNVWEWVEDCWNDNYNGAPSNGRSWLSGDCARRVLRGGAWYYFPEDLRSAYRGRSASSRGEGVGFRVARTLD